jgi:hypothetical protein
MDVRISIPKAIRAQVGYLTAVTGLTVPQVLGAELLWLHNTYDLTGLERIIRETVPEGENGKLDPDLAPAPKGS